MSRTIIQFIFIFFTMIFLQVMIFNNICLFNIAVPFVFIYFIVRLPLTLSTNWTLTLAFLIGLIIDILSDTPGMHSLACTITAMSRRKILQLYFPREDDLTNPQPTVKSLGLGIYIKYLLTMVLLYCTLIFIIESFTFFYILQLLGRICFSTILTFLLILAIDFLSTHRHEKRL